MSKVTRRYAPPIDVSDGSTPAAVAGAPGKYTLVANKTYAYVLGGAETLNQSVHLTGYTAGLVIASATIQDAEHFPTELSDTDTTLGGWITEDPPPPAFVAVDGTGWSPTNCVVAAVGTGVGGARWNLGGDSATRNRLLVVVGATGGDARVTVSEKVP